MWRYLKLQYIFIIMVHGKKKVGVTLVSLLLIVQHERHRNRRRRQRKVWVKDWLLERPMHGAFHALILKLQLNNEHTFHNFTRVSTVQFHVLCDLVVGHISKDDTVMRDAISGEERLAICLRFLATGDSYVSLGYLFRIHPSTICGIVTDVCRALYDQMKEQYLKFPTTPEVWNAIADDFLSKWQFPNCIGAIDGKHVTMNAPYNSGSQYFNYKGHNSIVLLAVVDANYEFLYVDVGVNGRVSDGGVFRQSSLRNLLDTGDINFPESKPIRDDGPKIPFLLVADEAFPLMKNCMKPYGGKDLMDAQKIFNYRLSRARRMVESAFGILRARFQLFSRPLRVQPEKAELVTLATLVLHNYIMRDTRIQAGTINVTETSIDIIEQSDLQLGSIGQQGGNAYSRTAKDIRNELTDYFVEEGAVNWQWERI